MQFLALIYSVENSDDVDMPTLMAQYEAFILRIERSS